MQYYSLQYWALLSPPDTSTTEHYFHFGPATYFFLELFLCSSPVAYWTSSNMGGSSSGVISSCLFILFMEFLQQEYWCGLPFLPPVDHILSELFTMIHPSWVAQHGMAQSFTEFRFASYMVYPQNKDPGFHKPHEEKRICYTSHIT